MKKFFTLLTVVSLAACSLTAKAEKASIYIYAYNAKVSGYVETEIEKLEDGSYSIPDFLGSGAPFSFKFTKPSTSGKKDTNIEITSTTDYDSDYDCYYLQDELEDDMECKFQLNETTYYIMYPSVYIDGDTYIIWNKSGSIKNAWDNKTMDYEYDLTVLADGYFATTTDVGNDDFNWIYFEIFFNGIGEAGVENILVDNNQPVEYYNLNGVRVENPSNGIFISKQGDVVKKVVLK